MKLRTLVHLFLLIALMVAGACTRLPPREPTPIKAESIRELQEFIREHKTELERFRFRGPFAVTERKNLEVRVSPRESYDADLYLAAPADKAPLVIFLHGYESSKEAHGMQAMHLASYGMHSLSVQLPKRGPWDSNGRALARIVRLIQRSPDVIDKRVDTTKIILVGHSFGASAVAVAMAEGAPAVGAILLDPAAIGRDLPLFLRRIKGPVLVLGADDEITPTRNRDYFFEYIRSVAELSIRDAGHEDAQFPSETALQNFGVDPDTNEELQLTFVSALTSAALSLAGNGGFDAAWTQYDPAIKSGTFFNARRK